MSKEDREIAYKLIQESMDGGKLNLKKLYNETTDKAQNVNFEFGDEKGGTRAELMKRYTRATREVLQLIPEADWDHKGEGWFESKDHPANYPTHLQVIPGTGPAKHDLHKSLAEQNYEFATPDYIAKQKQLELAMKSAQDAKIGQAHDHKGDPHPGSAAAQNATAKKQQR